MPSDEVPATTSPWRVYASWLEVMPHPNRQNDDAPKTIRCPVTRVYPVNSEADGWDVYRSLTRSTDWLPPGAIEPQVHEPWAPRHR